MPRPELRGRGQFLEVEAKAEAKNNEKVPNNDFKKMPDYVITQRDQGQAEAKCLRQRWRPRLKLRGRGRGQIFEAEANILATRT